MFIIVNHSELILTRSKIRHDHMIEITWFNGSVLEWYRVWSLSRSRWVSKYLYPAKMPQIRIINGSYLDTIHIADGYFYLENSSILLIQTENISVSHYRSLLYMNHIHCITVYGQMWHWNSRKGEIRRTAAIKFQCSKVPMGLDRTMWTSFDFASFRIFIEYKKSRNLEKVDSGAMLKYFMNFAEDIANITLTYEIFYIFMNHTLWLINGEHCPLKFVR